MGALSALAAPVRAAEIDRGLVGRHDEGVGWYLKAQVTDPQSR
jgi:hypothetical protein